MYIYTNTMYMPQNIISITEARKNIFKIVDAVQLPDNHYLLTENGVPKAVIISVEEFESLHETIETLIDIPDLYEDIKRVEADIKSGAYKKYKTLEEILKEEGLSKELKPLKKKYAISHSVRKKSRTRA
ncbi:MAG: type II toxin-antitoxin system Phd/YefM family antitoxin [Candidatus Gracilibacteria bacterium]